jgi:hypothetical protein
MTQQTGYSQDNTHKPSGLLSGSTPYLLLFNDDNTAVPDDKALIVKVDSIDLAVSYFHLLGDACKPCISPEYQRDQPCIHEKIIAIAAQELGIEPAINIELAATLMSKLPFDLASLIGSPIAVLPEHQPPSFIRKEMAHKTDDANVMVSEPFSTGNLHYFNMFLNTKELTFDHPSDHVQGMLILEALRQAGIATAHLQGLPMTGKLALLSYNTTFSSFIERGHPIILRSYSNFHADENSEPKEYQVCIQAFQWGKVCVETVIKAFACMNDLQQQQLDQRLDRIVSRQKAQFATKINRILETDFN